MLSSEDEENGPLEMKALLWPIQHNCNEVCNMQHHFNDLIS